MWVGGNYLWNSPWNISIEVIIQAKEQSQNCKGLLTQKYTQKARNYMVVGGYVDNQRKRPKKKAIVKCGENPNVKCQKW